MNKVLVSFICLCILATQSACNGSSASVNTIDTKGIAEIHVSYVEPQDTSGNGHINSSISDGVLRFTLSVKALNVVPDARYIIIVRYDSKYELLMPTFFVSWSASDLQITQNKTKYLTFTAYADDKEMAPLIKEYNHIRDQRNNEFTEAEITNICLKHFKILFFDSASYLTFALAELEASFNNPSEQPPNTMPYLITIPSVIVIILILVFIVRNTTKKKATQEKERLNLLQKEKERLRLIQTVVEQNERRIFEENQTRKGLVQYQGKWLTPEQVKEWKEAELGINKNFSNLSPYEFEEFIARLFRKMGYQATKTPDTGDYGADVVATKGEEIIAIQCKLYSTGNNIAPHEVQGTLGAMWKYKASKAVFVTTSDYSVRARELQKEAPIELWNKKDLHEMVRKYFIDELMNNPL